MSAAWFVSLWQSGQIQCLVIGLFLGFGLCAPRLDRGLRATLLIVAMYGVFIRAVFAAAGAA